MTTDPVTRPVFGSQAADNAAWDEIRAALRAEAPVSLHDEVVDDLASVVGSVLARLVDQAVTAARREDGDQLNHVRCWDQTRMLVHRWLAGEVPCGATGRVRSKQPGSADTYVSGPCLLTPGHTLPGHDDGDGGRW